jgi:hypothetical protein
MKTMHKIIFICLAVSFLAVPISAFAGGFCCQAPSGVQDASGGGVALAGDLTLRADYTYSFMSNFYSRDDKVSLQTVLNDPRFQKDGAVVPDEMEMQRITLSAGYSPTDRLRLSLTVPWVINDMTMFHAMNMGMGKVMFHKMKMKEVSGLGDVTLTGSYRIWQEGEGPVPKGALSVGAGVKFPTGSDDVTENGKRIHAHMQPGTGSWDPLLSVSYWHMFFGNTLMAEAGAQYRVATRNSLGYCYGDTAQVDAGVNYNALKFLNLSLTGSYFHAEQADDPKNNYNGQDSSRLTDFVGYTGEDSVWITPGVQVIPFGGASINFQFQYPVYYRVPDIEQVTDWRLTAGLSYTF